MQSLKLTFNQVLFNSIARVSSMVSLNICMCSSNNESHEKKSYIKAIKEGNTFFLGPNGGRIEIF